MSVFPRRLNKALQPNRAKLVRRVYIPKENGKPRLLGIPALEDKLVQLACTKVKSRFTFLGFERYGFADRHGTARVMRRTARKKRQGACRRIKEWIKEEKCWF